MNPGITDVTWCAICEEELTEENIEAGEEICDSCYNKGGCKCDLCHEWCMPVGECNGYPICDTCYTEIENEEGDNDILHKY